MKKDIQHYSIYDFLDSIFFSNHSFYENYRNNILSVNWNSLGIELNLTRHKEIRL